MTVAFLKIKSVKAVRKRMADRTKYVTQRDPTMAMTMPSANKPTASAYPCHSGGGGEVVSWVARKNSMI